MLISEVIRKFCSQFRFLLLTCYLLVHLLDNDMYICSFILKIMFLSINVNYYSNSKIFSQFRFLLLTCLVIWHPVCPVMFQQPSACPVCLSVIDRRDSLSRLSDTDGTGRLAIFSVPSVPSCFRETGTDS